MLPPPSLSRHARKSGGGPRPQPLVVNYNQTVTTLSAWNQTALFDATFNRTEMAWKPSHSGPKVLFNIITSPKPKYEARLNACIKTWAGALDASELQIVGRETLPFLDARYVPAENCKDNHGGGFACKEAHSLAAAVAADADWLVILGEDNYAMTGNIKKLLARWNPDAALYFGVGGCGAGELCADHQGGVCGGGGEILSRGALLQMMNGSMSKFLEEHASVAKNETGGWGDQATTCLARKHHVYLRPMGGIHPWGLLLAGVKKELRGSIPPLTFHYATADFMQQIQGAVEDFQLELEANRSASDGGPLAFIQTEADSYSSTLHPKVLDEYLRAQNSCKYSRRAEDVDLSGCQMVVNSE